MRKFDMSINNIKSSSVSIIFINTMKDTLLVSKEEQDTQKYIDNSLVMHKDCKILQCYMNDYTDCLKICYGFLSEREIVVYRIHKIQTKPNITSTEIGCSDVGSFKGFVSDAITQFVKSINNNKIDNNWEISLVSADNLRTRHTIREWEGETLDDFNDTIVAVVQEVIDAFA